ncbi:MAG: 2-hydroxyacyl-CoA dehydratase family protein [Candidatus Deferrimicrobiaceae bacterium]
MSSGVEWACRFATEVCRDPEHAVSRWKSLSGRRAAGCLPIHIPEEVLHAAGMLPVTVWGNEFVPYPPADTPPFGCSLAGGVASAIRSGRWGEIDAWVFPSACEAFPGAFDSLLSPIDGRPRFPFAHPVPANAPGAAEELLDRVEGFREWAGRISGREVSEGALEKSVREYNRNRSAFALLEERMRESAGSFSGTEFLALARSGMVLPKEAHTEILRAALSRSRTALRPVRAKVFLSGVMATTLVVKAIDAAKGAIVGNDLALGHRYYSGPADEAGDMPLALTRRHLRKGTCSSPHGCGPTRPGTLFRRFSESGADRLLQLRIRPCEPGSGQIFDLAGEARDRGVPFLCLDIDRDAGKGASAKARIASFVTQRKTKTDQGRKG